VRYSDGSPIKVYFCPRDYCEYRIIEELERANESVRFMTYSFTSANIRDTLLNLSRRGIVVEGIYEAKRKNEGVYSELSGDVELTPDTNPYSLHHKVFIIDNHTVITGSYNPTKNAAYRNDENVLVLLDEIIVSAYLEEYRYLENLETLNEREKTSAIVLSEIVYNPPGKDEGNEYVELQNTGGSLVDLRGWKLKSASSTILLDMIIPAGGTTRLRKDDGLFRLPNTDGRIELHNLSEKVMTVAWVES